MPVQTATHLNFRGDAPQALEFYQSVFGGDLVVNTCGESIVLARRAFRARDDQGIDAPRLPGKTRCPGARGMRLSAYPRLEEKRQARAPARCPLYELGKALAMSPSTGCGGTCITPGHNALAREPGRVVR